MAMRHLAIVDVADLFVLAFPGKLVVEIRSRAPRGSERRGGEKKERREFLLEGEKGQVELEGKVWQGMWYKRCDGTKGMELPVVSLRHGESDGKRRTMMLATYLRSKSSSRFLERNNRLFKPRLQHQDP